jgi:hypothetical protein
MFPYPKSQEIYAPTGETRQDAAYTTLTAGMLLNGSKEHTKAAIDGFENRERRMRLLHVLGLHRVLLFYMVIVVIGRVLLYFGVRNPEWTFRRLVTGMSNRKGAKLIGKNGKTMFLGLVPGLCEVGDTVVLCKGIKVPLVLRKRDPVAENVEKGEKWEFLGDAYVHGLMDGEMWEEGLCEDICII